MPCVVVKWALPNAFGCKCNWQCGMAGSMCGKEVTSVFRLVPDYTFGSCFQVCRCRTYIAGSIIVI